MSRLPSGYLLLPQFDIPASRAPEVIHARVHRNMTRKYARSATLPQEEGGTKTPGASPSHGREESKESWLG